MTKDRSFVCILYVFSMVLIRCMNHRCDFKILHVKARRIKVCLFYLLVKYI